MFVRPLSNTWLRMRLGRSASLLQSVLASRSTQQGARVGEDHRDDYRPELERSALEAVRARGLGHGQQQTTAMSDGELAGIVMADAPAKTAYASYVHA